jgi:SAM-dependent methyltransferase
MPIKPYDWCNDSVAFFAKEDASRFNLHQEIAALINQTTPARIIDYGGGDGRMIFNISSWTDSEVMIYDPDPTAVELAKTNFHEAENVSYRIQEDDLPGETYDTVICCNVMMCLSDQAELSKVISSLKRIKTHDGVLYLGMTHPCFLDRPFATYTNDYVNTPDSFDYFNNGARYRVFMRQEQQKIIIKDFFWNLSFLINKFLQCGLQLLGLKELQDITPSSFSPFLILTFK